MIVYLALRNLVRHKKRSLIIVLLFFVIITLFFIGNSTLMQMNQGMRKTFVENFTGDLVLKSTSPVDFGLFGANTPFVGEYFAIPVIQNYDSLLAELEGLDQVEATVSQVSGAALMDIHNKRYKVPLFGIEGDEYFRFFSNLKLLEGDLFTTGEEGILMTEYRANQIERETGLRPVPGDPILLTMFGNKGFKIREVPLKGIFSYTNSNSSMDQIMLVDVQTLRALNSITLASKKDSGAVDDLFSGSVDDLFGESDVESGESDGISAESVMDLLSQDVVAPEGDLVGGGWNFILIDLKERVNPRSVLEKLNSFFDENDINAEVISWRKAAGLSAMMVYLLQILYNGGFLLVLIAGIIAIVNLLVISVFERTGEIGTLRAIGASKGYIGGLFYLENIILSLIASLLALALSFLLIRVINRAGLTINNSLIVSLLGMSTVRVTFLPLMAFISMITSVLLGFLSTLFPVSLAMKIEPVTAVARG
ncbi:MAG: FtsX-like permease family protein [Spirochaetaceae bacterium]|nr:FtsX-like permease family protein [Spirochaetaceae bacterium]